MSYKKFTKNIGILGLTQIVMAIGGIITLPIITKFLGAQNCGVWTQLMVTYNLLSPIAFLGLPYTLVRFLAAEKNTKEVRDGIWSAATLVFATTALISLLLVIFSGPASRFLGCSQIMVQILAAIIMVDYLRSVFFGVFRAFQQIKTHCFFVILQELAEIVLIITTIMAGYGLLGVLVSLLMIRSLLFILMGGLIIKQVGISVPKFLKIREYLAFGLPTIPWEISSWAIQASDKYFVGFFLGTLFVGYYAPAYTLRSVLCFIIAPMSFILTPTLSKHHDENNVAEVKNYLKYSLKYFLLIAIPSVFGLSVLSKQLLILFSTPEIAQHSYYIIPFVALSILLWGIYSIFEQIIAIKKKTHIGGLICLGGALLNVALNFLLIPRLGILGAAITTLTAYAFIFGFTLYYCSLNLTFEIDWNFIAKSIVSSLVMSAVVFAIHPLGLWKTLGTVVLGALIYFSLILWFKGLEKREISFFKNLITG